MIDLEGDLFCEEDFVVGFGGGVASRPSTNRRGVARIFLQQEAGGSRRAQLPQAQANFANCDEFGQAPLVSSEEFFDNDFQGAGGIRGDQSFGHRGGRTGCQGRGRGAAATKPGKGKNFVPDEERQLARSVLAISQDPIVGNQQKSSAFWERIYEHYKSFNPVVYRGAQSLESKWGVIKHDALKFMGCYQQIKRLNKSGVGDVDIIRMAKELYRTKSTKNVEFTYEHCWSIVKDYPRWADGVTTTRQITPSKRKSLSSEYKSQAGTMESVGVVDSPLKSNVSLRDRPMGTKVAKEAQRSNKIFENAANRQAMATEAIADAQIRKVSVLEDQNMILLMQTIDSLATPTAQEYFRLRQEEELEKLRKRLAEKAERER